VNGLSLFSGIGGLELGLERAGITTVGQVEISPFCRRVLVKHWPDVPRHDDVRTAPAWWASTERPPVDVVFGGFPCQPFSHAGKQLGIADERWGWPWFEAVVRGVRPGYVVVENVAALLADRAAFGRILGDLARLGFDASWSVLRASDTVGAPHIRPRVFLVAYPHGQGLEGRGLLGQRPGKRAAWQGVQEQDWARPDARFLRVADGVSGRVDRLRALGNAIVPAVAEHVGRLIVAADQIEVAA